MREPDVSRGSPSVQTNVPNSLSPTPSKPRNQRPLEKPQLPPKPEVIPPPRKKPISSPKPEFLLKEASAHLAGCNREQSGNTSSELSPPKSSGIAEQDKQKMLPTMKQASISTEAEIVEHSASRRHSIHSTVLSPSAATCIQDISYEDKAVRATVKTPLQLAEEKYKLKKEKESKVEVSGLKPSSEAMKNGSAGCKGGHCHLKIEGDGSVESNQQVNRCTQENRCTQSVTQGSLLPLDCQTGLANQDSLRKPFLSAKCHANVLRKEALTAQDSALKQDYLGPPGASSCNKNQGTSSKIEGEMSEVSLSTSSTCQSKEFLKGNSLVSSQVLGDSEMKTEQNTEMETLPVVMRDKSFRETEDERLKRLSAHSEEIMKGNVKEAMEIYENLRKQEALQEILTRVKEFEEETSKVDVKTLRSFFENVPDWVVHHNAHQTKQPMMEKSEQMKEVREDADSISSVELAFEDLERASAEIVHLKEQTLSRLMDIEESIRKALCSISSLKSESDIAGLSGLLKESLGNSQNLAVGNNIRKISIISSKAKQEGGTLNRTWEGEIPAKRQEIPKIELEIPHNVQPRASSPSFISIQSAARKTSESPQTVHSHTSTRTGNETFAHDIFSSLPRKSLRSDSCNLVFCDGEQETIQMKKGSGLIQQQLLTSPEHLCQQINSKVEKERQASQSLVQGVGSDYASKAALSSLSPSNPRRQKSILELQTSPDGSKLYGATRTITEQYEEVDEFGNKIITSSTTVTKQSETQTSTTCDMISCPTRYEVTASPILHRYLNSPAEFHSNGNPPETGVVFVTFSNSKPAKK